MKNRKLALLLSAIVATSLVGCASTETETKAAPTKTKAKKVKPELIKPQGYIKAYGPSNEKGTAPIATPIGGFSSINFGNTPDHVYDNDFSTRWSSKGEKVWIVLDYGKAVEFNAVRLAFFKGDERITRFDIQVSETGKGWTPVIQAGESSGKTAGYERFPFITVKAQYIKFIGFGNTNNVWSAVTEFQAVNCKINECPASELIDADKMMKKAI